LKYVRSGKAAFLLTGLVLTGCGVGDMTAASAGASRAIDSLFQCADQGTWTATYETMTTSEFRQVTSKEEYEKLGRSIHDRLGKLNSKELKGFFVKSMNGVVSAEATYEAQFEKGKGTIRSRLKKTGDTWLILSFFVSSPEFSVTDGVPCKHCGKSHPKDAAFCPACGKKIDEAAAPPPGK
jgi:hypothetical protein